MALVLDGSAGISGVDGTASNPSLEGTDSNTGIFYPAADTWAVATGGTEALRVNSAQNMGLGATPSTWTIFKALEVGAAGTGLAGAAGQPVLFSNCYYNGGWKYAANGFAANYDQSSGQHRWFYAASGTAGNAITFTQAMTLDASGNLLVATTDAALTSGVGQKFVYSATAPKIAIVGSASTNASTAYVLYSTGAGAYRFYVDYSGTISATTTTITGISDVRLKENIRDLDDGLDAVMLLKPRKFDWKEGKGANIKDARGFIAQEFEQVFPDMIEQWMDEPPEGEEPYKAVNANLIPTLVKAIQELNAKVEAQAAEIAALKAQP